MKNVIVVPETDDFTQHVSHESVVWISEKLGTPKLDERNVQYLAPFWITEGLRGVNRIFEIKSVTTVENGVTEIILGNSFTVEPTWDNMGQFRKFEYHPLKDFGFHEIAPGLLQPLNQ